MSNGKSTPSRLELIEDLHSLAVNSPKGTLITRNFYRANSRFKENDWQRYYATFKNFKKAAGVKDEPEKAPKPAAIPIQDQNGELLHFKAKSQQLEAAVRTLLKDQGKGKALAAELRSAIVATEPYPRFVSKVGPPSGTPVAAVVKLSDWQIGEVVEASETEGFGEFNFAIAEQRVFKLVDKIIEWVLMHRKAGYNVRTLHLFSEGDLVSGNIHYELEVTNEFPVTMAAVKGGFLLAEAVARFAPYFDEIVLWEMSADNHGRLTRKSQAKQGAVNNYTYVGHVVCNEKLAKHSNVKVVMGEGTKLLADVLGKKFLISHGHHIMGMMGIPYYGMERDKAREAVKRAKLPEKMYDYISIGHWHVPAIISANILVNGSLPGTTEFDHMQGRHAPPSQVSFMVHPVHGVFNWTAWKL